MSQIREKRGVPDDWIKLDLGTLANLYQPETISKSKMVSGGEYLVFGANGVIGHHNKYNHENKMIIIGCRGTCGNVLLTQRQSWINGNAMVVDLHTEVLSQDYLFHLLRSTSFKSVTTGGAQPQITRGPLSTLSISFPESKKEQQKIAEVLGAVDEEIGKTKEVIKATEKFKKGLMQKLFTQGIGHKKFKQTEIGEVPENWQMDELGNSANFIDYRGKTPKKTDSGIPLITAKNVRQGYVSSEPQEFIAESDYDSWMTRGIPKKGDVLFTTEAPLGYVAQIDTDEKIALAQRVITMQSSVYDRTFLKYLLSAPGIQNRILGLGTGGTVKGIKASVLKKLSLPVPEKKEQEKIVDILSSVDEKISVNKKLLAKQTELKKGLMQDLLSGIKRVNV